MDIFWRLVLAHLLADFTFQTDHIAFWKRKDIFGELAHSLIFFGCAVGLCYKDIQFVWLHLSFVNLNGFETLFLLAISHLMVDSWRAWTIVKRHSKDSLAFFLTDQAIHLLLIFMFAPRLIIRQAQPLVMILIGLAVITHFTSILIYFLQKEFARKASIDNGEKYYSMFERIVVGACCLIPGIAGIIIPAAGIIGLITVRKRLIKKEFSWINIIAGSSIAVVCGIFVRYIIYSNLINFL